jgi:hypothetical protein
MKKLKYNYNYNPNDFKLSLFAWFSTANLIDGFYYFNDSIKIIIYQDLLNIEFKKVHYRPAEFKLAIWLTVLDVMNVNKTITSFKLEPKENWKIGNDFTSKDANKNKKKKINPPPPLQRLAALAYC